MKKTSLKVWSLLLVSVLLFTACTTVSDSGSAEGKTPASTASKADAASGEEQEQEVKSLKVLMPNQPTDPNLEPPHAKIIEKTGYNLEVQLLPAEGPDEKLNLELASGVEYDLLWLNTAQYRALAGKNAFIELDDLLASHGQFVMDAVLEKEWEPALLDGKKLGIPTFDARYVGEGIAANIDDLAEAGIPFKNTLTRDEFTQILRTLKEKNPDVIPYTGAGAFNQMIMSSFGLTQFGYISRDGEIVARIEDENLKAYVEYMHALYEEGLIDTEWPTNTGEVVNEKFTSGRASMASMGWWNAPTINEGVKNNTGSEVDYIHPLTNDAGEMSIGVRTGVVAFRAIPKSCTQPEEVMNFLNAYSNPENFPEIFIGEEGVHHEVREVNGVKEYWPIFPAFTEWFNGHYFNMAIPSDVFTTLWLCRVRKSEEVYSAFEKMNDIDESAQVTDALAYAPPMPATTKYGQTLDQMVMDTLIEFIAGSKDMSEWDNFIEKWKAEGGAEIMAETEAYIASING